MKEHKYRVWDKYLNEFVDINNKFANEIYIGQDGGIHTYSCDEGGCELNWADKDRYEITWYTGLKDKNGTEIYEGDKIKIEWLVGGKGRPLQQISEIKWRGNGYGNVYDSPSYYKIEVIGNIYENREASNGTTN